MIHERGNPVPKHDIVALESLPNQPENDNSIRRDYNAAYKLLSVGEQIEEIKSLTRWFIGLL